MNSDFCVGKEVKVVNDLGNAVEMNHDFPHLRVPNHIMIRAISPLDSVMISHQGERFWVKVDSVNEVGDHFEYIGKILTNLIYDHPFNVNDCIMFEGTNVLSIFSHEWKNGSRLTPNI